MPKQTVDFDEEEHKAMKKYKAKYGSTNQQIIKRSFRAFMIGKGLLKRNAKDIEIGL